MEDTIEIQSEKSTLMNVTDTDKKRTSTETDENSMINNNSDGDSIKIITEKQSRINEATKFFHLLFGKVTRKFFGYLWTKQGDEKITYPFDVSNPEERVAMARKAIELSDMGADVYYGINLMDTPPAQNTRVTAEYVTLQTATVTDIDIEGGNHVSNDKKKYPPTFDFAKSFLPFSPSILISSGYGLHALCIYSEPMLITTDNRKQAEERNKKFLELIRIRAEIFSKAIDGVGDLPRVLRVPGTFNYKLGKDNAPMCHIVEVSDVRFSPVDMDEKLKALCVEKSRTTESAKKTIFDYDDDNPDLKDFRIRKMLDYISVVDGEYEKWLNVGFALFNEGMELTLWENWSRTQPEFKEGECESKWKGFHHDPNGISIASLYQWAVEGGYNESDTKREWHQLNTSTTPIKSLSQTDSLKAELHKNSQALTDFNSEKNSAIQRLQNLSAFDSDTVFDDDIITAAAFAKAFEKKIFSDFRRSLKNYSDKHKEKKVSVIDWLALVRHKEEEITSRHDELLAHRNHIQSQIKALAFIADNNLLQDFSIPIGYSISSPDGVIKVEGKKIVQVCRRPIAITGKTFNVEEKIYKLTLAYKDANDEWQIMPPIEAATVFNNRKIVELANGGFPVTSSNATALVDYFDAFNVINENNFPFTYSVSRCGWCNFHGNDYFIDPRFSYTLDVKKKKIRIKVDSQSQFVQALQESGNLDTWRNAFNIAKKSPVARLIVSAAIAPPLLKILGERNFLIYLYAPTRAGKTTALYLAASAVGSEKMIRSFDATKNGLAGAAADVNDYVFLVDEKQVADGKVKEQLDTLVYALANGIGRTKLNKDSTLRKTADWRTIPIMTGETLLLPDNVTGGANTRLLTIAAPKVILDAEDCKQIRNIIAENFGLAFPKVINKILAVGKKTLKEIYSNIVEFFAKKYPDVLDEYRRYMAVLTVADALLNFALSDKGTQEELSFLLNDAKHNADEIFKLLPTIVEISDTAREKEFVLGFIAQIQNRLIGGNVPLERMQIVSGKFETDYLYITVAALKKACADEGFDYKKVVADLVEEGFFTPDDKIEKGRRTPLATVLRKIGETKTRCYRIRIELLK